MSLSRALIEIAAQTATALTLRRGDLLRIVDSYGGQVADLAIYSAGDRAESFSSGRTIDYNESLRLPVGTVLYSNRSGPLARVAEDTVGIHDILLAPCSEAMFSRRAEFGHPSCHANLAAALAPLGVMPDMVRATVNVFMDVRVGTDGGIELREPASKPGDAFTLEALQDVVIGVAACSSELTNGGRCKPICYELVTH